MHFFPERANYDEFYELVIRVVKIAFEPFAEYAQELLPKIKVPSEYVAAEPGLRKKCRQIKGTAGPRRARLMSEIQQEKKKTASKLLFMSIRSCNGVAAEGGSALPPSQPPPAAPTSPPPPAPIPDRYDPLPSDIVIPEVEFPSSGDEDFQVLFSALCIPSSPD